MLYHLVTWEDAIVGIEPPQLRDAYLALLERIRSRLADATAAGLPATRSGP
jgi:hypothetical protein